MFIHGWLLIAGGLAATAPVLVHWLTRPKPIRFPVSTLRFIRGAVQQRRSRYRLRDFLVLLLRTAAILLLAAAIARPIFDQRAVAALDETPASVVRIVILDCSQSMAARSGGIELFERLRPLVNQALGYQLNMKANLLLAAAQPNAVFDSPTTNLSALRESLSEAMVLPQRLQTQAAINRASELFTQASPEAQLKLVIYSDFQRSNWATVDFSVLPENCEIELKSIEDRDPPPNLAIVDVKTLGRVETGREAEFSIEIGNYSETPRQVRAELTIGPVVYPFEGLVRPRSTTKLASPVPIPGSGWQSGSIQLVNHSDALPGDDRRDLAINIEQQPGITLVSRQKRDQVRSGAYFMERAIRSTMLQTNSNQAGVDWTDAVDPDVDMLRNSDVMVLVRAGRLSRQALTVLAAMIQRGTSLLYLANDSLDVANLNDLTEILGSSVRMPVQFAINNSQRATANRFIVDVDRRQSPFAAFGDELGAAIRSLEFQSGLITRPTQDGLASDVRATFSDQSAFLTVTYAGQGKIAILNADLERSNLARTPILVPLIGDLISEELAGSEQFEETFSCGEPLTVTLPIGEERLEDLEIVPPEGVQLSPLETGTFSASPSGVIWNVEQAGPPGVYSIQLDGKSISAITTTIPPSESDLRVLSEDVFTERLASGRQLSFQSSSLIHDDQQDAGWVWFAAGCLFCVVGELTVLRMFRT